MRVFVVRPFGIKQGIDFDLVQDRLIDPAVKQLGIEGGTTGELLAQGNIRTDMFEQLLIADLVIADISIHNANVFYELGVRHALRDRHTVLIRSAADAVPFDLKTDRYLSYDNQHPEASVSRLVDVLRATQDGQHIDSPIFQLLPNLSPANPSDLSIVPIEFYEDVQEAKANNDCAYLQLLTADVKGLTWEQAGWRIIGQAQVRLEDFRGAKATWESIRNHYNHLDFEANSKLATIYQRMGDFVRSNQAIDRVLHNTHASNRERAEAYSLKGRNEKSRWSSEWSKLESLEARRQAALMSPYLITSFEHYSKGFEEDRTHYYSGFNALAMLSCWLKLIEEEPELWLDEFELDDEAHLKLKQMKTLRSELAAGVKLAIVSSQMQHDRKGETDSWANMSEAHVMLLMSKKPRRVAMAFRKALTQADSFSFDAEARQLMIYQGLNIYPENTSAAMAVLEQARTHDEKREAPPPHVLLFTGHRVDAANRTPPRFPNRSAPLARELIRKQVIVAKQKIEERGKSQAILGMAGGASGGDILFHEICRELDIPTEILLACQDSDYIQASVASSEGDWIERFKALVGDPDAFVRYLNADENFGQLPKDQRLPRWLRSKKDYNFWERTNLWILYSGLQRSQDDITLIALWNGQKGDGPGGTEDMVCRATERGASIVHIDSNQLLADCEEKSLPPTIT